MACETATLIDEHLAKFLTTDTETLSDGIRERARSRIRQLVDDRVFAGRRPQDSKQFPCVTLDLVGGNPAYHFQAESTCAYDAVKVTSWSLVASESAELIENVRRAITHFSTKRTNGAKWCGKVIRVCLLMSPPQLSVAAAFPGSDEYWYGYQTTWRIIHEQVVPRGGETEVL